MRLLMVSYTGKPCSANSMVGWRISEKLIVPKRATAVAQVSTGAGTVAGR